MKLAIDLPNELAGQLEALAGAQNRSREEIIRDALEVYFVEEQRRRRDKAFGIWGDLKIDSLEYQRKLREEWDD